MNPTAVLSILGIIALIVLMVYLDRPKKRSVSDGSDVGDGRHVVDHACDEDEERRRP